MNHLDSFWLGIIESWPGCVNVIEEDEEINSFLVNCKGTDGTSPKIDMPEAPKVDAQVEEMNLTPGRVDFFWKKKLCPFWRWFFS